MMTDEKVLERLGASRVTADTYEVSVLRAGAGKVVVAFFWAPWCEPCRAMAPAVIEAADAAGGRVTLVAINTDEDEDLARRQSVAGLPATLIFRHGEVRERLVGAVPDRLTAAIQAALAGT